MNILRCLTSAVSRRIARRVCAACRPEIEGVERRIFLSFYPTLAGPVAAVVNSAYTAYADWTGTQSPNTVNFHWGDGSSTGALSATSPPMGQTHTYTTQSSGRSVTGDFVYGGSVHVNGVPMTLNSDFGIQQHTGKSVTVPINANPADYNIPSAVEHDENGSIYVASEFNANSAGGSSIAVTRFVDNGTVDTTFANSGTWTYSPGMSNLAPTSMEFDINNGFITVGGTGTDGSGQPAWFVVSILPSAQPNVAPTIEFAPHGSAFQSGHLHTVQFDSFHSKLLLAGDDNNGHMVLWRVDENDGSPDTTFGTGGSGHVSVSVSLNGTSGSATAYSAVPQGSGGKPVIGGTVTYVDSNQVVLSNNMVLARFNNDGSLDTTFGSGGVVQVNFGSTIYPGGSCGSLSPSNDSEYALLEVPVVGASPARDDLIAVGKTNYYNGSDMFAAAAILESDGTLDNFYGNVVCGLSTGPSGVAYSADWDADVNSPNYGTVIGAGGNGADFVLGRWTNKGAGDSTFGSNGSLTTDFSLPGTYNTGYDVATSVDIRPAAEGATHYDCIVAVGETLPNGSGARIAMAEYLPRNTIPVNASGGAAPMLVAAAAQPASNGSGAALAGTSSDLLARRKARPKLAEPSPVRASG